MTVKVNWWDIIKGTKQDINSCPIALAAKREYATEDISVDLSTIMINGASFALPKSARSFIKRFDYLWPLPVVWPFSFEIK